MAYGGNRHINSPLSKIAVQYKSPDVIWNKFLKNIPVKHESDLYFVYVQDLRIPDTLRANKAPSHMQTWGMSYSSYSLAEHAISDVVSERDRANSDSPIAMDADTTEFLSEIIQRVHERSVARLLFTTTSFSLNETMVTATSWNIAHTTGGTPVLDILSATSALIRLGGMRPNTLISGRDVFVALKENTNIHERIKYVEKSIFSEQLLASIFDVDNYYVGESVYDAQKEGAPATTTNNEFIWGGDALLAYFNPSTGPKKVTAAVNLQMSISGNPFKVKKWRREELDGDQIEVSTMMTPKVVASYCGYLFKTPAIV